MRHTGWLVLLVALLMGCTGRSAPTPTAPGETTSSSPPTTESIGSTTTTSGSTTTADEDVEPTSTLRVGTAIPIASLDPADALSLGEWEILHAIGEGPLRRQPGDGELVPGLADGFPEMSDDGLSYTIDLRPDIVFADGTPLTGEDYAESINRVAQLGGRAANLVSLFVSDVEATDESTVVFRLRDRYAFFPTLLAGAAYLPVHPDVFPTDQLAPLPEAPVYGVGPWYIDSYSESEIVLEPNPEYSGNGVARTRIVIRVYETTQDMTDAMSSGEVDMVWRGLDSDSASLLSQDDEITVQSVPGGTMHLLTVNHSRPPTNDPLVRQAIAELIDRQFITDSVLGGAFVPAFSPVPGGYLGSSESFLDLYGEPDVNQAIQHLTDAGYTESAPAEIELAYPPERFGPKIAGAMEEIELQMESTGLIEVTLTAQPWTTYTGDVVEGVYNLAFLGWLHDFPDSHNYLAPFVLDGGLGGSGQNLEFPELTDLVSEASTELDEERRGGLYEEAEALYAQDVVTIPLWTEHPFVAYGSQVTGSEDFDNFGSLNIGESMQLDFRSIEVIPPDSG